MKSPLDKIYNPKDIEEPIYDFWEKRNYFKPHGDKSAPSYSIVIPPPNITGHLHMGHAFQQTIMDILIRYQRMQGKNTLWQPGLDHAGIATQMVVERKLLIEESKNRYDYGRDAFVSKIWQWKAESGNDINRQMRRLGNSIDWSRDRFTMDLGLSTAVNDVFIKLYREGLIYRGKRLVNWDPKLYTAISDLEVENTEVKGSMWYLRYPLADGQTTIEGKNYLVVATTRPETLLGDTAIAVNPNDPRYRTLIKKEVIVPFVNRHIPIIADEYTDMEKGTGCVKITPAHDFNDYEVGQHHHLPMINIFTLNGCIRDSLEIFDSSGAVVENKYSTALPDIFKGLDRFTARQAIVDALEKAGLLDRIEPHKVSLPYGDRSGVIIEPMLTNQWYVKAKMLAQPAIDAVKNGDIQFVPKQYENVYFSWMNNIHDWCISRQLWWGHRIPAWYDPQGHLYVGSNEAELRSIYNLAPDLPLVQEEDVLDTWFSSALWTFSTQGWPQKTEDLATFHPTNVLVTGFDIIFFWVARMIMMTLHFIKDDKGKPQVPFRTVYVTGLIRDEFGQKMSKSKGNVLDPLDMIDGISLKDLITKRTSNMMQPQLAEQVCRSTVKAFPQGIAAYGTDALRFTLAALASTGRNINWDMKRLEGYRNFCNKLWNASRYVLLHTQHYDIVEDTNKRGLPLFDKWIDAEFNRTVKAYRNALDNYRFDVAATVLYEFTWNQFCDWYLEFTKPVLMDSDSGIQRTIRYSLLMKLEALLRLAHPIIPFITEAIWQNIREILGIKADTIMLQSMPSYDVNLEDDQAITDIKWIKSIIIAVRNVRSEISIPNSKSLELFICSRDQHIVKRINENRSIIMSLARLNQLTIVENNSVRSDAVITKFVDGIELIIPISGLIDREAKISEINKELNKLDAEIERIQTKLDNKNFIAKAPPAVIEKERKKLMSYQRDKTKLSEQYCILRKQ